MKINFLVKSSIFVLILFSIIACENKSKSTITYKNKVPRHGHTQIHKNNLAGVDIPKNVLWFPIPENTR